MISKGCTDPEGVVVRTPQEYHTSIGFLSNIGPDSMENRKATQTVFNVGPSSASQ